jgi:S1-C subfamily serine protease
MKNYANHIFILLLITMFNLNVYAQNNSELPHSIIHLVRSGKFVGSACRTDITFPYQRRFNVSSNSVVNYRIYSEGEISITMDIDCPGTQYGPGTSRSTQVSLNIKRGNEYYVLIDKYKSIGLGLKEVQKLEVQEILDNSKNIMKQEENLDFPINKDVAKKGGKGQGTCFLISSSGYLITNYHCIENAKEITIKGIDGDFTTKYGAIIIASDPSNDLALLKLTNKNLKFNDVHFGLRSTGVAQGEKVYALGFPQAEAMGEEIKITDGIISARSGVQGDISKFQISASVNPGNSGGPLIDEEGNLIGVIYAKSTIADAAGYAIKASYLETFLKNADGFVFPVFINLVKEKTFTEKIKDLKNDIFIIETN